MQNIFCSLNPNIQLNLTIIAENIFLVILKFYYFYIYFKHIQTGQSILGRPMITGKSIYLNRVKIL